jgi:cell division protein FtsB
MIVLLISLLALTTVIAIGMVVALRSHNEGLKQIYSAECRKATELQLQNVDLRSQVNQLETHRRVWAEQASYTNDDLKQQKAEYEKQINDLVNSNIALTDYRNKILKSKRDSRQRRKEQKNAGK